MHDKGKGKQMMLSLRRVEVKIREGPSERDIEHDLWKILIRKRRCKT